MKADIRGILLLLLMLALPVPVSAAGDSAGRPRVGLVLGGGGARGAAHIGVLRELERMRVPIDAIAGTSMGAVVGGLYAAGMTPEQLEQLVESIDWIDSFTDESRRKDRPFRRKQDDAAFPMRLELGLRDGELQIPLGLVQGQKLGMVLRGATLPVAGIDDFDRLPIPFRAVASDIQTGEMVVLAHGDLPRAMRASMSVPGVFAPVIIDGRSLVDGGLVGNMPVSVIHDMNVDVVIAVDAEFPLYGPDEMHSALDITAQMLTILIRKDTRRQLAALGDQDILIRPELGNFGSTDFGRITDAIEPGARATRRFAERLNRLAVDETAYRAYLDARHRAVKRPGTLDFVRVDDSGTLSARVLKTRLKTSPGDPVDSARLADDAARLYGTQLYETVDYRLETEGDRTGVEFETHDKSWGPNYLQFGMLLQDDLQGQTSFNLATRLTRPGINRLGAEWRADLQIGTEPYGFTEFYQPLSFDSRYFIAPHVFAKQENFNVFQGDASIAQYRVSDAGVGIDVGRELGLWGELRVGAFRDTSSARVRVGSPDLPSQSVDGGGLFASFSVDTLDDAQIPHHGMRGALSWTGSRSAFGADTSYDLLESEFEGVWTLGRHTFSAGVAYRTNRDSQALVRNFFPLGGFLNLSGLARGEISGPHAGLARLVYYRRAGEPRAQIFETPLYLGASLEAGNVWQSRSEVSLGSLMINGSLFAAIDTALGPIYLGAGFAEGGGTNFYLSLGQSPR